MRNLNWATDVNSQQLAAFHEMLNTWTLSHKNRNEAHYVLHIATILSDRYGSRHDLDVLEIGPLTTTFIARALPKARYIGLDCCEALTTLQLRFLAVEGILNALPVMGDVYELPIATSSQDVVYAGSITPLCERNPDATRESLGAVFQEISRVLKQNGEFVMYPGPDLEHPNGDVADEFFRVVHSLRIPSGIDGVSPQSFMIYTKRRP